jgi:predicted DCC family thiol-disulfide oxidoreductase YuxK
MHRLRDSVAQTYFSFDARSLGLFRIVFGAVLLVDLYLRSRVLDVFYTNEGLVPNHTLLWAPLGRHVFSLFFTASHHGEALALMLLCAACFVCLMVGYRTRLAQVGSLIAVTSLNGRLALLENGGDVVMNLLAIWTVFLPLGARFSLDALLASLRAHDEQTPQQLNDRRALQTGPARVYSLACFALLLQFTAIYFFNVVHKTGVGWSDGSAVHYVLHQDRLVKPFGIWLREHLPPGVLTLLTRTTIVTETIGVLALVSPVFTRYTRTLAIILMPLMHVGFELCLDLGVFSLAMMSFFALLITPEHWRFFYRLLARSHARRRVLVDEDCGFCIQCARILARLDHFERLEFASNADPASLPPGASLDLADTTILVVDLSDGRLHQRSAAFAALFRSLPLGFLFAWPMQVPGLRGLADAAYDIVAGNRRELSVWLGYNACGLPLPPSAAAKADPEPAPARLLMRRSARVVRELCIALIMVAEAGEALNANAAVPARLRFARPDWLEAIVQYPRAFQGWRMFAPDAPLEDIMIEVDAETEDGRHVDPYNLVASRVHGPDLKAIPAYLHQNQFFTAYSLFIWMPQYRPYLTAFREWILRYHERTGVPRDRIVRFNAYNLTDSSPPPGQTQPTKLRRERFMSYP